MLCGIAAARGRLRCAFSRCGLFPAFLGGAGAVRLSLIVCGSGADYLIGARSEGRALSYPRGRRFARREFEGRHRAQTKKMAGRRSLVEQGGTTCQGGGVFSGLKRYWLQRARRFAGGEMTARCFSGCFRTRCAKCSVRHCRFRRRHRIAVGLGCNHNRRNARRTRFLCGTRFPIPSRLWSW